MVVFHIGLAQFSKLFKENINCYKVCQYKLVIMLEDIYFKEEKQ